MRISIFSFNERWIAKVEGGLCEVTFKVPHDEMPLEKLKEHFQKADTRDRLSERLQSLNQEWQNYRET
ncbi:MAG: hypothetical protein IPJ84_18545 [Bdellovibrionales bacterium]|nr:hypothetical protein [Bdellovibrionales bacterium]